MSPTARVLISREQAAPLDALVREQGLEPVHVPLIQLFKTGERAPGGRPDCVLLSSAAVLRFHSDLHELLGRCPVIAVGRRTASRARAHGLNVVRTGDQGGSAAVALLRSFVETLPGHRRVWHIGARRSAQPLQQALSQWGAPFERWAVYDNREVAGCAQALRAALPSEVVTFASGSAARVFAQHCQVGSARVAVIGPTTAAVARQVGLPVHRIAQRPSLEALAVAAGALSRSTGA